MVVSHSGGWPGYGTYIEKHLEKELGYKVETFLRTMDEVAKIVSKPAFTPQGNE